MPYVPYVSQLQAANSHAYSGETNTKGFQCKSNCCSIKKMLGRVKVRLHLHSPGTCSSRAHSDRTFCSRSSLCRCTARTRRSRSPASRGLCTRTLNPKTAVCTKYQPALSDHKIRHSIDCTHRRSTGTRRNRRRSGRTCLPHSRVCTDRCPCLRHTLPVCCRSGRSRTLKHAIQRSESCCTK